MLLEEPEPGSDNLAHVAEATSLDLLLDEPREMLPQGDAGVFAAHIGPPSVTNR
jgi:hypothetical protein